MKVLKFLAITFLSFFCVVEIIRGEDCIVFSSAVISSLDELMGTWQIVGAIDPFLPSWYIRSMGASWSKKSDEEFDQWHYGSAVEEGQELVFDDWREAKITNLDTFAQFSIYRDSFLGNGTILFASKEYIVWAECIPENDSENAYYARIGSRSGVITDEQRDTFKRMLEDDHEFDLSRYYDIPQEWSGTGTPFPVGERSCLNSH